jgi:hypothetical protein
MTLILIMRREMKRFFIILVIQSVSFSASLMSQDVKNATYWKQYWKQRGLKELKEGNRGYAKECFESSKDLDSTDIEVRYALADLYSDNTEDEEKRIRELRFITEQNPFYRDASRLLGEIYYRKRDAYQGIQHLRNAFKLSQRDRLIQFQLGLLLAIQSDLNLQEAKKYLEYGLEDHEDLSVRDLAEGYLHLARCYLSHKEYKKAKEAAQKVPSQYGSLKAKAERIRVTSDSLSMIQADFEKCLSDARDAFERGENLSSARTAIECALAKDPSSVEALSLKQQIENKSHMFEAEQEGDRIKNADRVTAIQFYSKALVYAVTKEDIDRINRKMNQLISPPGQKNGSPPKPPMHIATTIDQLLNEAKKLLNSNPREALNLYYKALSLAKDESDSTRINGMIDLLLSRLRQENEPKVNDNSSPNGLNFLEIAGLSFFILLFVLGLIGFSFCYF